jgi:hypothetical protein
VRRLRKWLLRMAEEDLADERHRYATFAFAWRPSVEAASERRIEKLEKRVARRRRALGMEVADEGD